MITRIEVNNFKSLAEFSLDFAPGLNVLVGPNGSGKTNIVSFFEFLAFLMETDASDATSRAGGAGAVFRRVGRGYEDRMSAKITGCVREPSQLKHAAPQPEPFPYVFYTYSFTLQFSIKLGSVSFEKQSLRISKVHEFVGENDLPPESRFGLDIEANLDSEGSPATTIKHFDDKMVELRYIVGVRPKEDIREAVVQRLNAILARNTSLVPVITGITPEFWGIASDLSAGQIYNIVPSRVKLPEDSSKPSGIARDGSGLAATLYALQRPVSGPDYFTFYQPRRLLRTDYDPGTFGILKNYLHLVNESIEDINVENDPFYNQLRVEFHLRSGNYTGVVPMSLMSDGTLKWVAVIAAALTADSVFSVEEPENYLHPRMQGQIVKILREILFNKTSERFTLMTTHSETLLNSCRPKELIIVTMVNGRTIATRCTNATDISEEITRTGFGLGHYYVTDALENV
jgi:predicted ATPase